MDFRTYWLGMPKSDREAFAARVESTVGHLNNVAYGVRPCAPDLSVRIQRASSETVTRRDLRRSDWGDIWPELIDAEHPWPAVAVDTSQKEAA